MDTSSRPLEELTAEFEKYAVQLQEQRYNQTAGFPYDKESMESTAETLVGLSSEFLNSYEEPRSFFLHSISSISQARQLPVSLQLYEKRNTHISTKKFKFKDNYVNWGSWRQFNAVTSDPKERQQLYDEFIGKAPDLAPLIMKRFEISRQVYSLYDSSPLDAYLEREFYSYEKLKDFILELGDNSKRLFLQSAEHFAPEILNKERFDYYDDFYVARGRLYTPLNKYFEKRNPIKVIKNFLLNWGFEKEYKNIYVDSDDREKKSPSAFCYGIQIPNDIRIVYKKVSPFSDFTSVFHEFGHAIHGRCGLPDDPYWTRYIIPMSVAETFSIFFEILMQNPTFLRLELNLSDEIIQDILDRRHFMNLYFLVFYSANSLLKLEFWKNNYNFEKASSRYQELTKRFFWQMPGDFWLLHHIMPNYDLYSPSYIIASIRVKEWQMQMTDEYGEEFWKDRQAGSVFRDLAATRGSFDLSVWDLDPKPYIEENTRFSFLGTID